MSRWQPHVTVATVVERAGRFLMVEEAPRGSKVTLFNQPAGHLEPGERLKEAALRDPKAVARVVRGWLSSDEGEK